MTREPVIVGIGLSDYPKAPHLDSLMHIAQASQRALEDCGLTLADIDGFACASMPTDPELHVEGAEHLGLTPRWISTTYTGGSAAEFQIPDAAAAIRDGRAEAVLFTYGSDLLSRYGRTLGTGGLSVEGGLSGPLLYEQPYGSTIATCYALAATRHMAEFGTTSEQLAEIAVGVREFASLNPNALYTDPITVDDVLASPMITDPLHLLDCCVIADGGAAFVMTTEERARDLKQLPIHVLGAAGASSHWHIHSMPDFSSTAGAAASREAREQAGISLEDVDTIQFYDSFTITVLMMLEDLGFCAKGEGGPFVQDGHLRPGGRLPLNTDGGGLSSCHSGMRGTMLITEAVRQLRGDAGPSQVPDCEIALAAGCGGLLSYIGVTILGRSR
ncbi:MAG: acetyl-CoA acetyltransferase [Acidimicrobiales bacterium]